MAVGDLTRDNGSPRQMGNVWELTGTVEVNETYTAFALTDTKSRLLGVSLSCEDGAGSAEVDINVNASGTATDGTCSIAGNHATTDTYRYVARYI